MEQDLASGAVNPRDLKARLAREIITRLRGAEAATAAEDHFDRVFRRHEAAADLRELTLKPADLEDGGRSSFPAVLERWFGQTRSEWRRRIQQGGVSLDGEPLRASPSPPPTSPAAVKAGKRARPAVGRRHGHYRAVAGGAGSRGVHSKQFATRG